MEQWGEFINEYDDSITIHFYENKAKIKLDSAEIYFTIADVPHLVDWITECAYMYKKQDTKKKSKLERIKEILEEE